MKYNKKYKIKSLLKAAAVIICLLMIFALAACGRKTDIDKSEYAVSDDVSVSERGYASEAGSAASGEGLAEPPSEKAIGTLGDPAGTDEGGSPSADPSQTGEALKLTGAEWNDNENWPFFTNLVSSGKISFPAYGLDPVNRIKVNVNDGSGAPVEGVKVTLSGKNGKELWAAVSGKNGTAYLFSVNGAEPASVTAGGKTVELGAAVKNDEHGQGTSGGSGASSDEITIVTDEKSTEIKGVQVMFIIDTTGSMGDELSYLQKDFASIAEDTAGGNITFSVNFYRDKGDEYVTKLNGFSGDIPKVQKLICAEYAEGGGDTPEAVAEILTDTLVKNGEWRDDCRKIAFLIFDAPPHEGKEEAVLAAAKAASARGIHVVPVVASNAERETELFGRALAICTGGTYVFLTDDSGVGDTHLEPIVGDYDVELLHDIMVRIINSYK